MHAAFNVTRYTETTYTVAQQTTAYCKPTMHTCRPVILMGIVFITNGYMPVGLAKV